MGTLRKLRIFLFIGLLLIIACLSGVIYWKHYETNIQASIDKLHLNMQEQEIGFYSIVSDTTIKCDLKTVSAMVVRMCNDGYTLETCEETYDTIEMILTNDNEIHHLRYLSNGDLTNISAPYEKSYVPFTYIYEK